MLGFWVFFCIINGIVVPATVNDDHASLTEKLSHDIGSGTSSCKRTASLATSALHEPSASLKSLASLYKPNGHHETDLHRWARKQIWSRLVPAAFDFFIPYANVAACGTKPADVRHSAILPHELFSYNIHAWRVSFSNTYLLDRTRIWPFGGMVQNGQVAAGMPTTR